jgi:putative ABC transport system substrate-binding protein
MAMGIRRRQFIAALGGAIAWPLAVRAQPAAKLPTIGFLGASTALSTSQATAAFAQRLRELGWTEGRNVAIEYRWTEGNNDRAAKIAAEFVHLNVDVIVTVGTPNTIAAKRATSVIPIVFVGSGDPVGTGLVASLTRPGGNITGLSNQNKDTAGKRVELLRDIVPGLRRLAIMVNVNNVSATLEMREVEVAVHTLGLESVRLEIRQRADIEPAMESLKSRADALYVVVDGLTDSNRARINILALGAQVPTMHDGRDQLEAGGLMSYGTNNTDMYRHSVDLVDKILHGVKPADIPVEQPTKFEFVISLITAKALGLTVPQSLLVLADDVIE